jgi:hypothetical protein
MTALAVVRPTPTLDELADEIRAATEHATRRSLEAVEGYFVVGRCLSQAWALLGGSTRRYGAWLEAQRFPFNGRRAYVLRRAAEDESAVRSVIASQLASGDAPNIEDAYWATRRPAPEKVADRQRRAAPMSMYYVIAWTETMRRTDTGRLAAELVDADQYDPELPAAVRNDDGYAAHLRSAAGYLDDVADHLRAIAAALDGTVQ